MSLIRAIIKRYLGQERGLMNSEDLSSLAPLSRVWISKLQVNRYLRGNKIIIHSLIIPFKTPCKTSTTFLGQFLAVVPVKMRRDQRAFSTNLVYLDFSRILDNNFQKIVQAAVTVQTTPLILFSEGQVHFSVKTRQLTCTTTWTHHLT
jgi:hypothetical protein